jgi:hypothetical protein
MRSPMKRRLHTPVQINRQLRTAEQPLNHSQSVADVSRGLQFRPVSVNG